MPQLPASKVEMIAEVCHSALKTFRSLNGKDDMRDWNQTMPYEQTAVKEAVEMIASEEPQPTTFKDPLDVKCFTLVSAITRSMMYH